MYKEYLDNLNLKFFCHNRCKGKGRLAGLSALQLLELIVPYPWRSSLIHLQRHHRAKRRESPLLAKEGTFIEGIWLATRNSPQLLGSFASRKVGTWDRLYSYIILRKHNFKKVTLKTQFS
jgi:hypothetical protein